MKNATAMDASPERRRVGRNKLQVEHGCAIRQFGVLSVFPTDATRVKLAKVRFLHCNHLGADVRSTFLPAQKLALGHVGCQLSMTKGRNRELRLVGGPQCKGPGAMRRSSSHSAFYRTTIREPQSPSFLKSVPPLNGQWPIWKNPARMEHTADFAWRRYSGLVFGLKRLARLGVPTRK